MGKKFSLLSLLLVMFVLVPMRLSVATTAASVESPYLFNFNSTGSLQEAGGINLSSSPYWWVGSGAYMKINNGIGSTIKGSLPSSDPWRLLYAANNPRDTDNGYHPQNIFRLTSRSEWGNARQEAYFVVRKDNLSASEYRNGSNGLLLFNRYQDSDNLYYTGVRVDGSAIIKKKKNGTYYTMAEIKNVYAGNYDRNSNPNLLPKNKWIGIRSEVMNLPNGLVEIRLYLDKGWSGVWQLVASVIDDGSKYGGSALTGDGFVGIRTDFMDVDFENFRVRDIDKFSL